MEATSRGDAFGCGDESRDCLLISKAMQEPIHDYQVKLRFGVDALKKEVDIALVPCNLSIRPRGFRVIKCNARTVDGGHHRPPLG